MRISSCFPASLITLLLVAAGANSCPAKSLVAYAKGNAIYTVPYTQPDSVRRICVGDDPCISSNGRFLAYTRNASRRRKSKSPAGPEDVSSTRVIVVRELSTGKETLLPAGNEQQVYGALWSPDDSWIAYNFLTGGRWQVAVAHPDGSALRVVTERLPFCAGYYLAGWNLHDNAILTHDLITMRQLDPATGDTAWTRPIKELTGEDSATSTLCCSVSTDGKRLVSTRLVTEDEFNNLGGPSSYLVLRDFPEGAPRRITPPKFDASYPVFVPGGETILLRGFRQKDLTLIDSGDGVKLRTRLYRYRIRSGKLSPFIQGGNAISVSR